MNTIDLNKPSVLKTNTRFYLLPNPVVLPPILDTSNNSNVEESMTNWIQWLKLVVMMTNRKIGNSNIESCWRSECGHFHGTSEYGNNCNFHVTKKLCVSTSRLFILARWPLLSCFLQLEALMQIIANTMLNELTLSENCGLGIPCAMDLNNGVTWSGELNSEFGKGHTHTPPTSFLSSLQDDKISVTKTK